MAKQRTPNYSFFRLGAVAVVTCSVLGLFISTSWAQTWVEPGISPTSGNVAGPIFNQNVSAQTPTASPFSNFWISGSGTLSTINLKGSASGTVTIQPAATAGTYTLTLPTSGGTNGQVLTTNGASPAVLSWTTVSGGTPAGNTGYVQFNNAGAFGADSGLFWDNTNKRLGIGSSTLNEKLVIGTDLGALAANTGVVLGDGAADSAYYVGQASGSVGAVKWAYNATAANGYLQVTTAGYANQVRIDGSAVVLQTGSGGNVGIRNTAPSAMLTLGTSASSLGTLGLAGNTSGMITIQPAAAAGTFTLVLPSAAPSAGQVLSVSSYAAPTITTGWSTVSAAASGSTGYMQFNNAGALGSDSTLFWDNTNKRLGVGNGAPGQVLTVGASGKLGTLGLAGNTSGVFTIQPAAAAGTFTLVLPSAAPSAGQVLSVSSYAAPTITTGWSTVSAAPAGSTGYVQFNNAGAMGSDSTFFWDNTNKRLGVGNGAPGQVLTVGASGKLGTLGLAGNTSGVFTIQPAAAAGTFTLVLPSAAPSAGQVLSVSSYAAPTITTSWTTVSGGGNMSCGGTCTTSYIPKFSSGTGIINSLLYDTGSYVGIGTNAPLRLVQIGAGIPSTVDTANLKLAVLNGSVVANTTARALYSYMPEGATYGTLEAYNYASSAAMNLIINPSGGSVGIGGITSPAQKLDVNGYIRAASGFCISGTCITSWPSGGGMGGSGTTNYVPKFTASTTLGNSLISDNGSTVSVGGALTASTSSVGSAAFQSGGGYYGVYVPETASPAAQYGVWTYGAQYGLYGYSYSNGVGVYGLNNTSGGSGPGVRGYAAGTGNGVEGTSHDGYGVYGSSTLGTYGFYTPNSSFVARFLVVGNASFTPSTGDVVAARSASSGVIYLGSNGGHYVYNDGSNYYMPSGSLNVGGGIITSPAHFEIDGPGSIDSTAVRMFDNGGNLYLQNGYGNYIIFRNAGGGTTASLDGSGNFNINGAYGYSDKRLKHNIASLSDDNGLDIIGRLNPVSFEWNDAGTKGTQYGFIAQDIQKVLPSLVMQGPTGMLSLNYNGLIAPIVKSLQQQQKEIIDQKTQQDAVNGALEAKDQEQQKEIDELHKQIAELKKLIK